MRKLHAFLFLASSITSLIGAADPVWPLIPTRPVVPQPMPMPRADEPIQLAGDQWYVINSKVECIVRAHPAGLVSVVAKRGPRDISARFVDGDGTVQDRSYDGPYIYVVRAAGKGDVELDIIPVGVKSEKDIITDKLRVDANLAPIPPPKPDDPPAPAPVKSFRVIWVTESGATLTATQTGVLNAKAIADYLNATCTKDGTTAGWRRYDKDTDSAKDFPAIHSLWTAARAKVTVVPCWILERDGRADILPFPESVTAALATLKTYAGEK